MSEYTEWIDGIPVHPVAALFPMIGDDELRALADDIKANGQREPIMMASLDPEKLDDWVVVDGRNRFRACEIAGVEPEFDRDFILSASDIGPWIMSHNRHRRHLSKSQMGAVAVEYEKWLSIEAKKRQGERTDLSNIVENFPQSGAEGSRASDEAGAMLGVSGRTVRDAKYVANNDAELFKKVRDGEIVASAAAKRIRDSLRPKPKPTPEEISEKLARNIAKHDEEVIELTWKILGEILGKER